MIEINDITTYLPEDSALNRAANAEIKKIIDYISEQLSAQETSDEDDFLVNLNGNPAALVEKHQVEILWETDMEELDEKISAWIHEANQ
ncbi:MAG: hypothetical protein BGO70_17000 [Bacteroidetes bacterium 43-93]|nr:hypothetical protein [Bacteroidota bacterium]OJX01450.1 MAG: hypothetical protein BGO70_17000 [Bacteroidetes bacterium 43-93]